MLKIFAYYAQFLHTPNYAGIIGWSLNKMPFKLPIYDISIFDESLNASVKLILDGSD